VANENVRDAHAQALQLGHGRDHLARDQVKAARPWFERDVALDPHDPNRNRGNVTGAVNEDATDVARRRILPVVPAGQRLAPGVSARGSAACLRSQRRR
jgi:hypothetical protein